MEVGTVKLIEMILQLLAGLYLCVTEDTVVCFSLHVVEVLLLSVGVVLV